MKKKYLGIFILIALVTFLAGSYFYRLNRPQIPLEKKFVVSAPEATQEFPVASSPIPLVKPNQTALLSLKKHVYQTFNNCGPATLSMILAQYGIEVSQAKLGEEMRPYQNPKGDNDDKTIFINEFAEWAKIYGLTAEARVNGDLELLKTFIANDIPVVVKTWLHSNDDIGHFRIIKGYDEDKQIIIQDDSYQGPNKKFSYYDLLSIWQPFNYGYVIVYPPKMEDKVQAILGEEVEKTVAWENALARAEKEKSLDENNPYPVFNISISSYHLGDYQRSAKEFETVETRLPRRMLWYQIEPILAYQKLKNYDRVFEISERIFNNGNRAFSELYLVRGQIYLDKGEKEKAREQFELALNYHQNLKEAKDALESL